MEIKNLTEAEEKEFYRLVGKINAKQPSIKAYTLSHFKIGDVCMGVRDEHYYLVVKSEKEKKQLVDLTENEIIRDAGYMRFIPAIAELNIKDVG